VERLGFFITGMCTLSLESVVLINVQTNCWCNLFLSPNLLCEGWQKAWIFLSGCVMEGSM